MQKRNVPFVKYKFDSAFIISPWIYLFDRKPGWNGSEPYYCIEVLIKKNDATLMMLNKQLESYEKDKIIRLGYYKLVRDINFKNHDQEIDIFTKKGHNIHDYAVLYMKRKSGEPDLVSRDNHKIERIPENAGLFSRGVKVNVLVSLGVNTLAGQPYLSLSGVQYVGPGFSSLITKTVNPTAFAPVKGTSKEHTFGINNPPNLGNKGAPLTPTDKEMEDQLNAMLASSYVDDAEAPF